MASSPSPDNSEDIWLWSFEILVDRMDSKGNAQGRSYKKFCEETVFFLHRQRGEEHTAKYVTRAGEALPNDFDLTSGFENEITLFKVEGEDAGGILREVKLKPGAVRASPRICEGR